MKKIFLVLGMTTTFLCALTQNLSSTSNSIFQRENEPSNLQTTTRAPWNLQFQYPAPGPTVGIATDGEFIYYSRFATNEWTKLNLDGSSAGPDFIVPGLGVTSALTYDGRYFYSASIGSNNIKQIDLQATPPAVVGTINLPAGVLALHCTYDPTADDGNGGFWVGHWADGHNFFALVNRSGTEIRRIEQSTHGLAHIIGTVFDNVSPGGPYLWAIDALMNADPIIYQINLNTGLQTGKGLNLVEAGLLEQYETNGGGMLLAQNIVPGTWTLAALAQGKAIYGWDLSSTTDFDLDMGVTKLDLPAYIPNTSNYSISGKLKNHGLVAVTSYQLGYRIDNGAPVTTHITGVNLAPGEEVNFTHPTTVTPVTGYHTIKVWVSQPNNTEDQFPGNDTITFRYTVYALDNVVSRTTLLEGFTACTCGPCVQGNVNLKNVLTQNATVGGKYSLVKYQMNFPGNGDPYYTLEVGARSGLYNINGVPWLHGDGQFNIFTTIFNNTQLLSLQNEPSFLEISGNFEVVEQAVNATIKLKPTIDLLEDGNLKLFVAIVEKKTVKNTGSNGEKEFTQVMKKFMPDANGIELGDLMANETITKNLTWEFKGDYRLPQNGQVNNIINHEIEHSVENFDSLEVIAWVQNIATKRIFNSCTAIEGGDTALIAVNKLMDVEIYPNPFASEITITNAEQIQKITISNTLGQIVKEEILTGNGTAIISTQNLNSGLFFITLRNKEGVEVTKKVIKQ